MRAREDARAIIVAMCVACTIVARRRASRCASTSVERTNGIQSSRKFGVIGVYICLIFS